MKCPECQEVVALISRYLDRELPDDVCERIRAHLASCPSCVEFVDGLRKSIELCRACRCMDKPGPLPKPKREQLWNAYQQALAARRHAMEARRRERGSRSTGDHGH